MVNVFLCYPSEHQSTASEVKNFVRSVGVECWYDKDILLPGEDWDRMRRLALSRADIVVIVCASQLLERDGVYQREINEALQVVADKRAGSIFIVPFRVENIALPPELSKYHWVDHFDPIWKRQLSKSFLRVIEEKEEEVPLGLKVAAAEPDEGGIIVREFEEHAARGDLGATWPEYNLQGQYWRYINSIITVEVWGGIFTNRRHFADRMIEGNSDWYLDVSEYYRRGEVVSLTVSSSSYYAGAAHPNHLVRTINIFGGQAGIIGIDDLFEFGVGRDPYAFIHDYVSLDLKLQYGSGEPSIDFDRLTTGSGSSVYEQFNVNDAGIRFNFSAASGFPHFMGLPEVYIPWERLGEFLTPTARRLLFEA